MRVVKEGIWCAAVVGLACAAPVPAAEVGFGGGVSLAYDSNINRVETNPQSDWTRGLTGIFFLRENTVDLTARVDAQIEQRHFYYSSYNDDIIGFVDGSGVWTLSPRRLTWSVDDIFRMVQKDLTAPNTPSNLTQSNTLSTGPDYTLSISSTNSVVIGGRYGRFDIKYDPRDNQRLTGYVRGVHALNSQANLSLNYEGTHMYFNPGAFTFTKLFRQDVFGRFESRSGANRASLDLGTTWVTQYGDTSTAPQCQGTTPPSTSPSPPPSSSCGASSLGPERFARLTFLQNVSSQSWIRVLYSQQVSDTFSDLLLGVISSTAPRDPPVVVPASPTFASAELYRSQRGELAYSNSDGRFAYTLQGYGRRIDFVSSDQNDFNETGGAFLWGWVISDAIRLSVSAYSNRRLYTSIDRRDLDRDYTVRGTYRVNGNISASMYVERVERQSTVAFNSYVDNRVGVSLSYVSGVVPVQGLMR